MYSTVEKQTKEREVAMNNTVLVRIKDEYESKTLRITSEQLELLEWLKDAEYLPEEVHFEEVDDDIIDFTHRV